MVVAESLIIAVWQVANILLTLYMYMIIARALISWVQPDPYNPIVMFLTRATEPVLRPIREKLPYMGGMDVSPVVVILIIVFLQTFIGELLNGVLHSMSSSPAPSGFDDYNSNDIFN